MSANRITPLATSPEPQQPITLEQVKEHLKITVDIEDSLLQAFIDVAVAWCEENANRKITERKYRIVRDDFPVGFWNLPLGKIQSVDQVQYVDVDGVTQTWTASPQEYELDNQSDFQARLRPKPTFSWPSTGDYLSAAIVDVTAGWTANDIPYTIRQAILLKVAALNESRAPGDPEPANIIAAAKSLLMAWKLPGFA